MCELDKNYHSDLKAISLSKDLLNSLPQPIADIITYIETEDDPQLKLQALCLTLIPLTFQYFALILSSEYLFTADPPDIDVMDNLWGMIRRPGTGKWVGFIRSATDYFSERKTQVIPQEAIQAFQKTLLSDKRPRVRFPDRKRLDYYEALINMRNRFAHSRQIPKERAEEMFSDHYLIWKALISILPDAFEPRVLIADEVGISYYPHDNRNFENDRIRPSETDASLILWNDKTGAWLKILPLVIAIYETENQNGEALMLEEVKGKNLLYLYHDTVVKRKEEFRELIHLLDARSKQEESITSEELTVPIFGERIDRITHKTLMNFEDTFKFIPGMFIVRESFSKRLDSWLEDERPGCIIVGEPGVGKTSLVADWCIKRRDQGDHVLLLEASKLDYSDIPKILENLLNLRSPLNDCLDSVYKQSKDVRKDIERIRFIIVIDAINEFVGSGVDNRTVLWREINSLIDRIDGYRPFFKCLVTTRSDLWKSDFPKKDSADYSLKRRLYYGDEEEKFPRISVGSLKQKEAEEIYEKARISLPGMVPLTPYNRLPEKTKSLIINPFSLRLVVQTFHDREVPSLTITKLNSAFTKEKVLEEKEKKDILFRLHESVSRQNKVDHLPNRIKRQYGV
ncbi:hypothetical protein ACFL6P_05630 [Candidatus Latescibacterota bacterium]